jgi:hypothetical protein
VTAEPEKRPVLITPVRGKPYLWSPRDWAGDLERFLKADSRLPPDRIAYYRQSACDNNAHILLAQAQVEAAGWPEGGRL